ncbi:putative malate dehydrogenase 1B [Calliopsis andreniformis]|uniref:putative malate dehydrogenase 1B n=1 Tax=Calliopsis andreniformis TaxID=337506 RepID=UPI003FCD117F
MSEERCVIVIAGLLEDRTFNHIRYVAESLATILPNFHFRSVCKNSAQWKSWLQKTCKMYGWDHTRSPLIWKEIGISRAKVTYIGGGHQFWELLRQYYNIESHLSEEELDALQKDLLYAYEVNELKSISSCITEKYRRILVLGAGRSMCFDLIPQLIMLKELWLTHGTVINLYDEPGCYFKLKRIFKDAKAIGGGLNAVNILEDVSEGLKDCDILIHLDSLSREDHEGTDSWLQRNYTSIEELSTQINQYAPSHMKVIFCSMGLVCFYVNIMHELVKKLPKTNIIAVSSHYGLELIYAFVNSLGLTLRNFGCPPVWGYLGINQFVDVHHMIQKHDIYQLNKRALKANENALPLAIQRSELRWFFYMAHDKNPYKDHFRRKALSQYQVGRSEDFQTCRAICDLLKLWYTEHGNIGDEIISLGIASDGSFGIPKGVVFSQPVYLKVLKDQSRIWVPFTDFPMPNMPIPIFQNFIETAVMINNKISELRDQK